MELQIRRIPDSIYNGADPGFEEDSNWVLDFSWNPMRMKRALDPIGFQLDFNLGANWNGADPISKGSKLDSN